MTTLRWRLQEIRPTLWWAVDERNGTAYALDDPVAVRLWASEHLLREPLSKAVRAASQEASLSFVDLRFLGLTVRYRSRLPRLVERVRADFAGAHPRLRSSPDVVVELGPEADIDRLHRSASVQRPGVYMRAVGEDSSAPGSNELPVLPPLQHPHFSHCCALHAALLETANGNMLVCGQRRSGKTTTAAIGVRLGLASVLTDELVLVDPMGRACGVPLPMRERTGIGRTSYPLSRNDEGVRPVEVHHVVTITPAADAPRIQRVDDAAHALSLLAPHLRPLAGPLGTATGNLLTLMRHSEVWDWGLRPWPALTDDIAAALTDLSDGRNPSRRAATTVAQPSSAECGKASRT